MGKPKIRFKGYTEDWEQRKLGDVYNFQYGEFNNNPDNGGEYPIYGANGIIGGYTKYNAEDSAIIGHMGAYAGYVVWASGKHFVTYNGTIARPSDDSLDLKFGYYMLSQKQIYRICAGSGQPFVSYADLNGIDIKIPIDKNEQEKIGVYFSTLDCLITLHQRKCDEAKKLKKCMLQKMFPKDGEKVPEIRFSGFASDWKQRKLGEIVNRITRKNSKLISELPLTISAQQGLIDQNEFFNKRVASKDVSGYYLIKNGEFAYNKSTSNDAPWGAIKRLDRYENGVLSTLYIVFEIKDETLVNSDFLVAYYGTNLWHKGIHEIAAEGARNHGLLNIAPTDFFKTKLKLPADIEEQQEIGEYFKKIDSLITFHQQKCDELKNIKRFMLQNIFVSEK